MTKETLSPKEDKSLWDTRLFRIGAIATAVGFLMSSPVFFGIGVAAMGGVLVKKRFEK